MKKLFINLNILLFILSLMIVFSACAANTGVSIYGVDTSAENGIDISPVTDTVQTEEVTDAKAESEALESKTSTVPETTDPSVSETALETEIETAIDAIETVTEAEEITDQVESEVIPEETTAPETEEETEAETAAPETEKQTEAEATEKVEDKSGTEYLLNTNSKKFHHISCKSGQKTKDVNRAYHTGTREEVIAKGYVPCKVCNP